MGETTVLSSLFFVCGFSIFCVCEFVRNLSCEKYDKQRDVIYIVIHTLQSWKLKTRSNHHFPFRSWTSRTSNAHCIPLRSPIASPFFASAALFSKIYNPSVGRQRHALSSRILLANDRNCLPLLIRSKIASYLARMCTMAAFDAEA